MLYMCKSSTFKSKSITCNHDAPLALPLALPLTLPWASLISYQIFAFPFFSFSFFLVQAFSVQRTYNLSKHFICG